LSGNRRRSREKGGEKKKRSRPTSKVFPLGQKKGESPLRHHQEKVVRHRGEKKKERAARENWRIFHTEKKKKKKKGLLPAETQTFDPARKKRRSRAGPNFFCACRRKDHAEAKFQGAISRKRRRLALYGQLEDETGEEGHLRAAVKKDKPGRHDAEKEGGRCACKADA